MNKKNKDSLKNFWENMNHNNISIIGVPGGEEQKQGGENLFEEVTTKSFPNLVNSMGGGGGWGERREQKKYLK